MTAANGKLEPPRIEMSKAPKVPGWGRQPPVQQPSDACRIEPWQGLAVIGRHQARFIYDTNHTTNHTND